MKKCASLILLLSFTTMFSQSVAGEWYGKLNIMGSSLALSFDFKEAGEKWTGTMSVPQQNAKGIPLTSVTNEENGLQFLFDAAGITFTGKWNDNQEIEGTFTQNGQNFPLVLTRENKEILKPKRPQEPKAPFPYEIEEVSFENTKDKIKLAGTYTYPNTKKPFPVVVLISGSGPQNRNSEILDHQSFWVIADYLTRNGIAVLRFDERGIGKSEGNFANATSYDFATDVEAAIAYLKTKKGVDNKKIGLIGHSEGGMIAPIVASKDKSISFIVLLAGPGIPCSELLVEQNYLVGKTNGMTEKQLVEAQKVNQSLYAILKTTKSNEEIKPKLKTILEQSLSTDTEFQKLNEEQKNQFIKPQLDQMVSPWFRTFIQYEPSVYLEKVKCPMLVLNGDKDIQVAAQSNTDAIKRATTKGKNKKVEIKIYPQLNHLFQTCTACTIDEYGSLEETFSPLVMTDMKNWILQNAK
jgi:uncharacterized protein